jgi:hypothetical protein
VADCIRLLKLRAFPRLQAAQRQETTIDSAVADATRFVYRPLPWLESHGYIQVVATRHVEWEFWIADFGL